MKQRQLFAKAKAVLKISKTILFRHRVLKGQRRLFDNKIETRTLGSGDNDRKVE